MSRIKLKICGVQSAAEARQLADAGVDYLGLNFVPTSPRAITIETAQEIATAVKDRPVQIVALFRNQPLALANDYAAQITADYVQLHGDESADYAHQVQAPIMKAIAINPTEPADHVLNFIANYPAAYFVLDRQQQGQGQPVALDLAQKVVAAQPEKIFLAGGLGPDNLSKVLDNVHPYGIDIASGVRTADGILDMTKVNACLKIIAGKS